MLGINKAIITIKIYNKNFGLYVNFKDDFLFCFWGRSNRHHSSNLHTLTYYALKIFVWISIQVRASNRILLVIPSSQSVNEESSTVHTLNPQKPPWTSQIKSKSIMAPTTPPFINPSLRTNGGDDGAAGALASATVTISTRGYLLVVT